MMSERLENNISPDDINDYEIPEGLNDLLHEFAVSVLIEKPHSLHDFAADYFTKLRDSKKAKTIPMYIVVDDDDDAGEPEQLRYVARCDVVVMCRGIYSGRVDCLVIPKSFTFHGKTSNETVKSFDKEWSEPHGRAEVG